MADVTKILEKQQRIRESELYAPYMVVETGEVLATPVEVVHVWNNLPRRTMVRTACGRVLPSELFILKEDLATTDLRKRFNTILAFVGHDYNRYPVTRR